MIYISMIPKALKSRSIYNPPNLVQIQDLDDERELSISTSTIISLDIENFPRSALDHLDGIYSYRSHKRCMNLTYLTLLSMTFGVIFWMIYWLSYEYCSELLYFEENIIICKSVFIFEMLIFVSIGFSPILFILMIISWIKYSCKNPIDKIRNDFIGFRLEGIEWKNQLNYYFKNKKSCFQFCSYQKQKELLDRNFGYIILSSHGIIFDELFIFIYHHNIIRNGILMDHGRILKLEFQKCCKNELLIYLPDQLINQEILQQFMRILKINININASLPSRF